MARPNKPGSQSAKEQAPVKAPDADLEEEGAEKSDLEQEQQRDQNLYGNAAMSAIMGVSVAGTAGGGGPGHTARELEEERSGDVGYGGDDDDVVDGPLTIEDLTRSWNPRARRGKEVETKPPFALWEDLPEEDASFLSEIRARPIPQRRDGLGDGLYQPTISAVTTGLSPWTREVRRWARPTLANRMLLQLTSPPASFLQDPGGRSVFSRARAGAIATCVILDGVAPDPAGAALTQFCLELAGSGMRAQEVWRSAEAGDTQLPLARDLADAALSPQRHRVAPRTLSSTTQQRLLDAIVRLADLSSPRGFIPDLQVIKSKPDPDDPLGIDDVLAAFTGAAQAPDQAVYDTALRTAERMASSCAHTRIRYAGVSVAIGDISSHWSSGTPTADLVDICSELDLEVQGVLKLLVEVARAAKRRSVEPAGLRNGLKRAARMIDRARTTAAKRMAYLIGGVLLPDPNVAAEESWPSDPLSAAWQDGKPEVVRDALLSLPDSIERVAALALIDAVLSNDPSRSVQALLEISDSTRQTAPPLSAAVDICLGGCAIWAQDVVVALDVADRQQRLGHARRNGMILASGALTAMAAKELAGDPEGAAAIRMDAGTGLFHMGANAALSLLARWSPDDAVED